MEDGVQAPVVDGAEPKRHRGDPDGANHEFLRQWQRLPPEVQIVVVEHADACTLGRVARTCRWWTGALEPQLNREWRVIRPWMIELYQKWGYRDLHLRTKIRRLSFPDCTVGDVGATALARAVFRLTALRGLHLSRNRIGDVGATALARALSSHTALQELWLDSNQIGDAGAVALARALPSLAALQWLILSDNQIGDAGTTALAQALPSLTALQVLTLDANQIGDAGATELIRTLHHLRVNDSLFLRGFLWGNPISDAFRKAQWKALRGKDSLYT